ncbi:hypothetical protein [Cohnella kolymensis]|uniref:hypothetical protein n=1 Tax=Cohnella kolymensis TaxID=1590652 RepID=UPI0006986AA0|nr:hypothetical protein [Cohnella kolymensis]
MLSIIISVFLLASLVAAKNPHTDRFNYPDRVDWALKKLEKATEKYRDVNKAIADGYTPTDEFVPNMGYHYINFRLIDDQVDALMPEVVIYVPDDKGGLKLVAVEYISTVPNHLYGLEFHQIRRLQAVHIIIDPIM